MSSQLPRPCPKPCHSNTHTHTHTHTKHASHFLSLPRKSTFLPVLHPCASSGLQPKDVDRDPFMRDRLCEEEIVNQIRAYTEPNWLLVRNWMRYYVSETIMSEVDRNRCRPDEILVAPIATALQPPAESSTEPQSVGSSSGSKRKRKSPSLLSSLCTQIDNEVSTNASSEQSADLIELTAARYVRVLDQRHEDCLVASNSEWNHACDSLIRHASPEICSLIRPRLEEIAERRVQRAREKSARC